MTIQYNLVVPSDSRAFRLAGQNDCDDKTRHESVRYMHINYAVTTVFWRREKAIRTVPRDNGKSVRGARHYTDIR